jgi:hypothetical protein
VTPPLTVVLHVVRTTCASAMLQIVFEVFVEKLEVSLSTIHPVSISTIARQVFKQRV